MVRCGSVHPSDESHPAWRENCSARWQSWSKGRLPNPWSSARQPSPKKQTCWPYRFRTSPLPQHLWRRQQNALQTNFHLLQSRQLTRCELSGIGHRLERSKSLGRHDEQRLRRIEIAHRFGEIGPVDVGNESEGHGPFAVVAECFIGHDRPEIGAANSDIDDVANAFSRVALPFAMAHAI